MPERDVSLYIIDILIAIDRIKRYSSKFTNASDFNKSELEWDASIRELQIIGDAANILLKNQLIDKSYRRIVDFRNQITHAYFGIDEEIVWEVINKKLQVFNDDLISVVKNNTIDISDAIEAAKKENIKNHNVISFLARLKNDLYPEI